jgi:hypothetical protein
MLEDATWFVVLSVLGDIDAPGRFDDYWIEAVKTDPAIVELLGAGQVATAYLPAEVVERLAGDARNFWARIEKPPIAQAFAVISASSEDAAASTGKDVASRQAARVLGDLASRDLMQYLSFSAGAERFDSPRPAPAASDSSPNGVTA